MRDSLKIVHGATRLALLLFTLVFAKCLYQSGEFPIICIYRVLYSEDIKVSIPVAENYMAGSSLRVTWLEMGYKLRLGGSEKARALFIAGMAGAWFSALTERR